MRKRIFFSFLQRSDQFWKRTKIKQEEENEARQQDGLQEKRLALMLEVVCGGPIEDQKKRRHI